MNETSSVILYALDVLQCMSMTIKSMFLDTLCAYANISCNRFILFLCHSKLISKCSQ